MKTDELITMLAGDAGAVALRVWQRRYALALGVGLIGAALLMVLLLGVRPDIADAIRLPMFWVKLAFPAALAAGLGTAAVACAVDYTLTPRRLTPGFELRLSRPAMTVGFVAFGLGIAAATIQRGQQRREAVAAPLYPAG